MVLREIVYRIKGLAPLYRVLGTKSPQRLKKRVEVLERQIREMKQSREKWKGPIKPADVMKEYRLRYERELQVIRAITDLLESPIHKSRWERVKTVLEKQPEKKYIVATLRDLEKRNISIRRLEWLYQKLEEILDRS